MRARARARSDDLWTGRAEKHGGFGEQRPTATAEEGTAHTRREVGVGEWGLGEGESASAPAARAARGRVWSISSEKVLVDVDLCA